MILPVTDDDVLAAFGSMYARPDYETRPPNMADPYDLILLSQLRLALEGDRKRVAAQLTPEKAS